jgi:hypothetical protein
MKRRAVEEVEHEEERRLALLQKFSYAKILDPQSGEPGTFIDFFQPIQFLGAGSFGAVLLCNLNNLPDFSVHFGGDLMTGKSYAVKIQPDLSTTTSVVLDEEKRQFAQKSQKVEALVYAALSQYGGLPVVNIAQAHWFMRLFPTGDFLAGIQSNIRTALDATKVGAIIAASRTLNVTVLDYYDHGSFGADVKATAELRAIYIVNPKAFLATVSVMLCAGMHILRTVAPDVRHNDFHSGNIFGVVDKTPDDRRIVYMYRLAPGLVILAPLRFVLERRLVIGDFGLVTGTYSSTEGPIKFSDLEAKQIPDLALFFGSLLPVLDLQLYYALVNIRPLLIGIDQYIAHISSVLTPTQMRAAIKMVTELKNYLKLTKVLYQTRRPEPVLPLANVVRKWVLEYRQIFDIISANLVGDERIAWEAERLKRQKTYDDIIQADPKFRWKLDAWKGCFDLVGDGAKIPATEYIHKLAHADLFIGLRCMGTERHARQCIKDLGYADWDTLEIKTVPLSSATHVAIERIESKCESAMQFSFE